MKKKLLAGVMGALVLFFTLAPNFVSLADVPDPAVTQEVVPDAPAEPAEGGEPPVVEPTDNTAGNPENLGNTEIPENQDIPQNPADPQNPDVVQPAEPNVQTDPVVYGLPNSGQEDLQNIELNNYLVLDNLDN